MQVHDKFRNCQIVHHCWITRYTKVKYLGINLPKETKNLCAEDYKTLMEEIKDDTNIWRDIPCSWIGRIKIVKMTVLPKAIYRFDAIPIKLPIAFFTELKQKISQFVWKHKRPQRAKTVIFRFIAKCHGWDI